MTKNQYSPLIFFAAILAAFLFPSCMANRLNLVAAGFVTLDKQCTGDIHFSSVFVYQEEDKVEIRGYVKRRYFSIPGIYRGHVDLEITDNTGKVIKQINSIRTFPGDIPRRGIRRSLFSTECSMTLPENANIRLRYHRGRHC